MSNKIIQQKVTKDKTIVTAYFDGVTYAVLAVKETKPGTMERIGTWFGKDLSTAEYWYRNVKKLVA